MVLIINLNQIPIQAASLFTSAATSTNIPDKYALNLNETVTINYSFKPQDIAVANVPVIEADKEIVIVVDTSKSMEKTIAGAATNIDADKRIEIVKAEAKAFVEKFKNNTKVKVALIYFSNKASAYKNGNNTYFCRMSNTQEYNGIYNKIGSLGVDSFTNIGDAFRQASVLFDSGSSSAKKYLVYLTDGEPNYYSWKDNAFYTGTSLNSNDYNTQTDTTLALNYSQQMASLLAPPRLINSYFVAFSSDATKNKLELISTSCNAYYRQALSKNELSDIYTKIAEQINQKVIVSDVQFEETFSNGLVIDSVPVGFETVGQTVKGSLGNAIYSLNQAGTFYTASPINFSIKLKAMTAGTYNIALNNVSKFIYKDVDGTSQILFNNSFALNVNNFVKSETFRILEVQPQYTSYELSQTLLASKFSYTNVVLEQMPMSQFIARIEELNGKYDIIYVGNASNLTSPYKNDYDITNKRAEHILKFIQSGQLVVFKESAFSNTGTTKFNTKLKGYYTNRNVSGVNANPTNVKFITTVNDATYTLLNTYYEASTKRPNLEVTVRPTEYDGNNYSPTHLMSFLYNAYNRLDDQHTTNLYIDINGDGLFTADEIKSTQVVGRGEGYAISYQLPENYSGCLPWKLEIIDMTTGAKDYETGFTFFKGIKQVIRVLQIIPQEKNTSRTTLDLNNSTQFQPTLITDDYEIVVKKIGVKDFDNNYPNVYNGVPTEPNGNYDMVIFGFDNAYGRDILNTDVVSERSDIVKPAAINAIKNFIATKQGVMFTHDTIAPHGNFAANMTANFRSLVGFTNVTTPGYSNLKNATVATMDNTGLLTKYPYVLANNASNTLAISSTHDQWYKIDFELPELVTWFTLNNSSTAKYEPVNYYYTFTNGNITFSGSGDNPPTTQLSEQQLFVNTIVKASKGSNHAPTMDVYNIANGQNIPPTQLTIDFSINVHDIDIADENFVGDFYIKANGVETKVKTINLKKDVLTAITLDKNFSTTTTAFEIRMVVKDTKNAEVQKSYNLLQKAIPTLVVSKTVNQGYLVGDTIDLAYTINADKLANEAFITNPSLLVAISPAAFTLQTYAAWTKTNNDLVATPSFADKTRSISFKAIKEGNYIIPSSATYLTKATETENATSKAINLDTPIDIKKGIINVEVTDNLNRGIKDIPVFVYDGSGNKVAEAVTNAAGVTGINQLSSGLPIKSGNYTVKIQIPAQYPQNNSTEKTITMSYDTYIQNVKFSVQGSAITEFNRQVPSDVLPETIFKATYSFVGDNLNYDSSSSTINFIKLKYKEVFPANIEIVTFPSQLVKTGSLESGFTLEGDLTNVTLQKIPGSNLYSVQGGFELSLKAKKVGIYNLSNAVVTFTDPNNANGSVRAVADRVNVSESIAPIIDYKKNSGTKEIYLELNGTGSDIVESHFVKLPKTTTLVAISDFSSYLGTANNKPTDMSGTEIDASPFADTKNTAYIDHVKFPYESGYRYGVYAKDESGNVAITLIRTDDVPPIIKTKVPVGFFIQTSTNQELTVYVELDGTGSDIYQSYFVKLANGDSVADVGDFSGLISETTLTNMTPMTQSDYSIAKEFEPFKNTEFMSHVKFKVSSNGEYAIYAKDEDGNITVYKLKINTIFNELPSNI